MSLGYCAAATVKLSLLQQSGLLQEPWTPVSWTNSTENVYSLSAHVENLTGWPQQPLQQEMATISFDDHIQ